MEVRFVSGYAFMRAVSAALSVRLQALDFKIALAPRAVRSSQGLRPGLLYAAPSGLGSTGLDVGYGYLSNSEDQLRMTERGAELDASTFVLTRNFCASAVTS